MNPAVTSRSDLTANSKAHVFVEALEHPVLTADDQHHLARVLRVRPTDLVGASDGAGGWRPCFLIDGALRPAGDIGFEARPSPQVRVCLPLLKGDRTEWALQKLTELGVDEISLLAVDREVVGGPSGIAGRTGRQFVRLLRVIREAAMQSRQVWLPELTGPLGVTDLANEPGVARADLGGAPIDASVACLLIGPPGGWTEDECRIAPKSITLGSSILRSETAALVAGTLLVSLRARIVNFSPESSQEVRQ